MGIRRVMKAPTESITDEQLEQMKYPIVGSAKLDGFRCIVDRGVPLTASMKPFPNRFVNLTMSKGFDNFDGEIVVGKPNDPDAFHNTSGPLRRFDGEPDFTFYVFDDFTHKERSYYDRWLSAEYWREHTNPRIVRLEQRVLHDPEEVRAYEAEMVEQGYEGAMIRSIDGKYKEGRCTFRELNMFKRKPFADCEAVIIDLEEQMENLNEAYLDERGLTKRSKHQENLVPKDTLGNFVLFSALWQKPFRAAAGKGFNAVDRKRIWDNRLAYKGLVATVKYQKHGSWEAPRMPTVIKIHI